MSDSFRGSVAVAPPVRQLPAATVLVLETSSDKVGGVAGDQEPGRKEGYSTI